MGKNDGRIRTSELSTQGKHVEVEEEKGKKTELRQVRIHQSLIQFSYPNLPT